MVQLLVQAAAQLVLVLVQLVVLAVFQFVLLRLPVLRHPRARQLTASCWCCRTR